MVLENVVLTVILVAQFQAVTETFHSMTPEGKEMSSVMIVRHII